METKNLLNKKITQWLLLVAMLVGCSANVWAEYKVVVHFAPQSSWAGNHSVRTNYNRKGDGDWWGQNDMGKSNKTYAGRYIYDGEVWEGDGYSGLGALQFQYDNNGWTGTINSINGWTSQSVYKDKLYSNSSSGSWVNYEPDALRIWRSGSAWDVLDFENGSVTTSLTAGDHSFTIRYGGSDRKNNGTMTRSNCTGWVFDGSSDCKITADIAGNYTFKIVDDNGKPKLSVTYPKVYIKHNWNGSGWSWKEMQYNSSSNKFTIEDYYGGTGCNYNSSESDTGAGWIGEPTLVGNPQTGDKCTFTLDLSATTITIAKPCTAPSITSHPSTTAKTYCQDVAATALSVTASGTVDSYQWYSYTNAACTTGEAKITSATSSSYTPSTATVGTLYYKCKVTGCNTTKTSNASGAITVNPKITFSSEEDINFGEVAINSESDPVTVNITTCNLVGYVCELFGGNADQFSLSKVDPAQTGSGSFTVKFTPKNTGNFTTQVRVAWSGDAKLINVSGTGIKSCTPPTAQNVSLSGCSVVNMDGSQSGYTYTLYKDDVKVDGSDWAGDGNAHSWSVATTGTYTVKAKDTETGGCLTTMNGSANVTKLGPVVTFTPSEIHPYEVTTFTASGSGAASAEWSIQTRPSGVATDEAYLLGTTTGTSVKFKGEAANGYVVRAAANGCNTDTQFNVVADPNNCN